MESPLPLLSNEPFYRQAIQFESDEAFLLLHGLGGGVYEMQMLATSLHQQGYTVAGINYPGHDAPSHWMPDSTWQQWYSHVEATYRDLAAKHASVSVIGFSTGCMLALHLASNLSQEAPVNQLVLLSPFLKIKKEWYYLLAPERYVCSIGRLIRQVPRFRLPIHDAVMQDHAKQAAYFKTFNLNAVRSALELIQVVSSRLDTVQCPTLIIQSPKDTVVCPSGANLLMEKLGSSVKQVHWLQESNHIILLDIERETVIRKIHEFIAADSADPCSSLNLDGELGSTESC